jgi:hypothetical protein
LLEKKTTPEEKPNYQEDKNSTKSDTAIIDVRYLQGEGGINVRADYTIGGGDTIRAKNVQHGSNLAKQIIKYEMNKENKDDKKDK